MKDMKLNEIVLDNNSILNRICKMLIIALTLALVALGCMSALVLWPFEIAIFLRYKNYNPISFKVFDRITEHN